MTQTMAIHFSSTSGEHGGFSNFSPHAIRVDGVTWPSSEHYFQANKFPGTPQFEQVRRARTPAVAAQLGRTRKFKLRPDWESVKVAVMRRALEAKFQQHDDLRAQLLATGRELLI